MKRIIRNLAILSGLLILVGSAACSDSTNKSATSAKPKNTAKVDTASLPNYRYVDMDTILSRYALAKDYSEQMLRLQNNLESEARKHESSIGSFAKTMENKYKNNGYLSEASFNQDQERLASMQAGAQKAVGQLQANMEKQYQQAQKIVNDSIQAFVKIYMQTHQYDAILFKNATLYINPALDITDEIVEGLNARYNKKSK